GKTVGILLPYVMVFNLLNPEPNDAKNQYYELESQAEIEKGTLISEVKDLLASVNISLTLKDLAIKEEIFRSNLDMMVSIAGEYPGAFLNSRTASDDDIRRLFQYSYEGKDIDF
ncbi:MAG: iron-containing alcohol dehydrogenase, partial [Promethearchaeota archaeon]